MFKTQLKLNKCHKNRQTPKRPRIYRHKESKNKRSEIGNKQRPKSNVKRKWNFIINKKVLMQPLVVLNRYLQMQKQWQRKEKDRQQKLRTWFL